MDQILKQISFLQDAVVQDALLALGLIAALVLVMGRGAMCGVNRANVKRH